MHSRQPKQFLYDTESKQFYAAQQKERKIALQKVLTKSNTQLVIHEPENIASLIQSLNEMENVEELYVTSNVFDLSEDNAAKNFADAVNQHRTLYRVILNVTARKFHLSKHFYICDRIYLSNETFEWLPWFPQDERESETIKNWLIRGKIWTPNGELFHPFSRGGDFRYWNQVIQGIKSNSKITTIVSPVKLMAGEIPPDFQTMSWLFKSCSRLQLKLHTDGNAPYIYSKHLANFSKRRPILLDVTAGMYWSFELLDLVKKKQIILCGTPRYHYDDQCIRFAEEVFATGLVRTLYVRVRELYSRDTKKIESHLTRCKGLQAIIIEDNHSLLKISFFLLLQSNPELHTFKFNTPLSTDRAVNLLQAAQAHPTLRTLRLIIAAGDHGKRFFRTHVLNLFRENKKLCDLEIKIIGGDVNLIRAQLEKVFAREKFADKPYLFNYEMVQERGSIKIRVTAPHRFDPARVWTSSTFVTAFLRANRGHPFQDLVLRPDVFPVVTEFAAAGNEDVETASYEAKKTEDIFSQKISAYASSMFVRNITAAESNVCDTQPAGQALTS